LANYAKLDYVHEVVQVKEWGKKKKELNTEFGGLPTVRWNG
jgi:hypothetical protein